MKYPIIILIACLILTSCMSPKRLQLICNLCPDKSEKHDSIYLAERWDTVKLPPIEGPIIYLQNPCDSLGRLKPIDISKTKKSVRATVKNIGNTIAFNCETDSLKAYIQLLKEKYAYSREKISDVKYIPCKNERTWFDTFTHWWFWITLAILAIWIYFKIRSFKLPI